MTNGRDAKEILITLDTDSRLLIVSIPGHRFIKTMAEDGNPLMVTMPSGATIVSMSWLPTTQLSKWKLSFEPTGSGTSTASTTSSLSGSPFGWSGTGSRLTWTSAKRRALNWLKGRTNYNVR